MGDEISKETLASTAEALLQGTSKLSIAAGLEDTFSSMFSMHTERGAILNAAALVDEILADVIQGYMIRSSLKQQMFKPGRAFGDFGVRIGLAYLLGIISKSTYQELEVVREIRNRFAHDHKVANFSHTAVAAQAAKFEIIPALKSVDISKDSFLAGIFNKFDLDQPRFVYLATCIFLVAVLLVEGQDGAPLRSPRAEL
jgi:DNA-binding MltR family transcriptional regulator